jgi:hypothetical protein
LGSICEVQVSYLAEYQVVGCFESDQAARPEQPRDKVSLASHIFFCQSSHSPLPDHVHRFDSLQRPPCSLKGAVAFGQPNSFFYCSMVLLGHVVEIFALT